jgi:hypothetical protein
MIWKKYEVFFTYLSLGALRGYPPLRWEAEKPEALERGGRLPPSYLFFAGYGKFEGKAFGYRGQNLLAFAVQRICGDGYVHGGGAYGGVAGVFAVHEEFNGGVEGGGYGYGFVGSGEDFFTAP